jgi:hypothetical protein
MARDNEDEGKFDAIRARAARMRIDSLQARLNSVSLLCDIAGNANPKIAAEALERAQTAFDRIRQELRDSQAVTAHATELSTRAADIEAELARATQLFRIARGEEHGRNGWE